MKSASKLISEGKYGEAIEAAEREIAAHAYNMDFNLGAPMHVGEALLCLGRYDEAGKQFENLIRSTHPTVSDHFIGAGLARWFAGEKSDAFRIWRRGLKAGYATLKGLDIRFILYYAAASSKMPVEMEEAISQIRSRMNPYQGIGWRIAQFLVGDIDEGELLKTPSDYTETGALAPDEQRFIDFYIGTRALKESRRRKFLQMMRKATGFDSDYLGSEEIIARKELRLI